MRTKLICGMSGWNNYRKSVSDQTELVILTQIELAIGQSRSYCPRSSWPSDRVGRIDSDWVGHQTELVVLTQIELAIRQSWSYWLRLSWPSDRVGRIDSVLNSCHCCVHRIVYSLNIPRSPNTSLHEGTCGTNTDSNLHYQCSTHNRLDCTGFKSVKGLFDSLLTLLVCNPSLSSLGLIWLKTHWGLSFKHRVASNLSWIQWQC